MIFESKRSLGAIFAKHFDPFPLPTLALEFSAVCPRLIPERSLIVHLKLEHCAQEWSTGQFAAAQFTEKAMIKSYNKHLEDVEKWAAYDLSVTLNIRRKWYARAS